jgi:hypothetical protein
LFSTEIQKGGVGAKIAGIGEAKPYRGLTQMNADQDKGGGQSEAPKGRHERFAFSVTNGNQQSYLRSTRQEGY